MRATELPTVPKPNSAMRNWDCERGSIEEGFFGNTDSFTCCDIDSF
jgi:hypothetical protein